MAKLTIDGVPDTSFCCNKTSPILDYYLLLGISESISYSVANLNFLILMKSLIHCILLFNYPRLIWVALLSVSLYSLAVGVWQQPSFAFFSLQPCSFQLLNIHVSLSSLVTNGYYQTSATLWHAFQEITQFWRVTKLTVRGCQNQYVTAIFLLLRLKKRVAADGCVHVSIYLCMYAPPPHHFKCLSKM